MTQIAISSIIGIVCGIFTSLLIYLWTLIFREILLPWYKRHIYKGIDIGGEWYCGIPQGRQRIVLNISQTTNQLSGSLTLIAPSVADLPFEPVREFVISGIIQDRLISLIGKHKNPQRLGIGSFLLEITRDGCHLSGIYSYLNVLSNKIDFAQVLFHRNPNSPDLVKHAEIAENTPVTQPKSSLPSATANRPKSKS